MLGDAARYMQCNQQLAPKYFISCELLDRHCDLLSDVHYCKHGGSRDQKFACQECWQAGYGGEVGCYEKMERETGKDWEIEEPAWGGKRNHWIHGLVGWELTGQWRRSEETGMSRGM